MSFVFTGRVEPRILVIAACHDPAGAAARLAGEVALALADAGADVTRVSLLDHPLPLHGTGQPQAGVPDAAARLVRLVSGHDAWALTAAAVNGSLAVSAKNLLDWLADTSQGDGDPVLAGRPAAGFVAGADLAGAATAANHLESVLAAVGAAPHRVAAFDEAGLLRGEGGRRPDDATGRRLQECTESFFRTASGLPGG